MESVARRLIENRACLERRVKTVNAIAGKARNLLGSEHYKHEANMAHLTYFCATKDLAQMRWQCGYAKQQQSDTRTASGGVCQPQTRHRHYNNQKTRLNTGQTASPVQERKQ
jgi:hypothetical protein